MTPEELEKKKKALEEQASKINKAGEKLKGKMAKILKAEETISKHKGLLDVLVESGIDSQKKLLNFLESKAEPTKTSEKEGEDMSEVSDLKAEVKKLTEKIEGMKDSQEVTSYQLTKSDVKKQLQGLSKKVKNKYLKNYLEENDDRVVAEFIERNQSDSSLTLEDVVKETKRNLREIW